MEADEIRAAIAARKRRASDLKLRESLWTLYSSHLKYFQDQLIKDHELIAPEIKDTLVFSGQDIQFCLATTLYRLRYSRGREERDRWGGDNTVSTHALVNLYVEDNEVFAFSLRTSVTYTPEMPLFDTYMGEISCFIEGPWVKEIPALVKRLAEHKKAVWDRRNTPRLNAEMKNFGL